MEYPKWLQKLGWPFTPLAEPPIWIQVLYIVAVCIISVCCVCVHDDWWWGSDDTWKWRRMWKSDARVDHERHIRNARCCEVSRDEWREWARTQDLIVKTKRHPLDKLWVRNIAYRLQHASIYLRKAMNIAGADEVSSKPHLLNLPPEIRRLIYRHYTLDWSKNRINLVCVDGECDMPIPPHDPPLARVCRDLRNEYIPFFYRTSRFPLIIHSGTCYEIPRTPMTAIDWYHHLGPSRLCLIRHLELYICFRKAHGPVLNALIFHVDLEPSGNKVYIAQSPWALRKAEYASRLAEIEQQFLDELLRKFSAVALSLGSAGIVTANNIYQFVD